MERASTGPYWPESKILLKWYISSILNQAYLLTCTIGIHIAAGLEIGASYISHVLAVRNVPVC